MKGSAVSRGHEQGLLEAEPVPRPCLEETKVKLTSSTERRSVQQLVVGCQRQDPALGLPSIFPATPFDEVSIYSNDANCSMLNLSVAELMEIVNEP